MSLLFILLVLAVIAANVDGMPLSDAIYFIFITALTVGYGDITPGSGATQAISVLAGVVGVIFPKEILSIMGAEPDLIAEGYRYTQILLGGNVTILLLFLINAVLSCWFSV